MDQTKQTYENVRYYATDAVFVSNMSIPQKEKWVEFGEQVAANPNERAVVCPECHSIALELVGVEYRSDENNLKMDASIGFLCRKCHREFYLMFNRKIWESHPDFYTFEIVEKKSLVDHIHRKYGILTPMGLLKFVEARNGFCNQFIYIQEVCGLLHWHFVNKVGELLPSDQEQLNTVWSLTRKSLEAMNALDVCKSDEIRLKMHNEGVPPKEKDRRG